MTRAAFVFGLLMAGAGASWGQGWMACGSGQCISGNVGIGTGVPLDALTVGSSGYAFSIGASDVGSGAWLRNDGANTVLSTNAGSLFLGYSGNSSKVIHIGNTNPGVVEVFGSAPVGSLVVASNGWVGIGRTSPAYNLDVNGSIGATDIYVSSNALPDYVFDADYRNAPLNEVAAYIEQNHHLPGMPSAAEAERDRLSVGEMQNKLLEKVEELTLHMISAEKRSDQLTQTNEQLAQQNRELERQIAELRAQVNAAAAPARGK